MKLPSVLSSLAIVAALVLPARAQTSPTAPLPQVDGGRFERIAAFPSRHVDPRSVDVWVPEGCSAEQPCAVIYLHDGQMLFDAGTTWNRQAWDVHTTITRLVREGRMAPAIAVGVWNNGPWRHSEYFPQKFLPHLREPVRQAFTAQALKGKPQSDAYLRFLIDELKPAIDARFPTRPGREHTFTMGASMGGVISIYAMNEHPQVFGGAAGLSTHWVGGFEPNAALPLAAFVYLRDHLADPATHRLYMDHGTTELDAIYAPYQRFVDQIVRDRGYTTANSLSRVFEGSGHNERAWAARLEVPLLFLLGRR